MAFAYKTETLQELMARAESARVEDRPALCLEIAERQLKSADELYTAGKVDDAQAALKDVVTYSEKAHDAAIQSGKKVKNAEIAFRKMAAKLRDIKRSLNFDDQAARASRRRPPGELAHRSSIPHVRQGQMISAWGKLARLALAMSLLSTAWAQRRRDPLNPMEQDQLRDAAQEPSERLKLYILFARTRLTSLEQMRADPKVTDRAQQTRDRLQDFLDVYDELNDNIDTFVQRKADLRKPLKTRHRSRHRVSSQAPGFEKLSRRQQRRSQAI